MVHVGLHKYIQGLFISRFLGLVHLCGLGHRLAVMESETTDTPYFGGRGKYALQPSASSATDHVSNDLQQLKF